MKNLMRRQGRCGTGEGSPGTRSGVFPTRQTMPCLAPFLPDCNFLLNHPAAPRALEWKQ